MKKAVSLLVVFLLVISVFSIAQTNEEDLAEAVEETSVECGFGCKVWQFFFGDPVNRAGKGWFDRSDALVGKAEESIFKSYSSCTSSTSTDGLCQRKGMLFYYSSGAQKFHPVTGVHESDGTAVVNWDVKMSYSGLPNDGKQQYKLGISPTSYDSKVDDVKKKKVAEAEAAAKAKVEEAAATAAKEEENTYQASPSTQLNVYGSGFDKMYSCGNVEVGGFCDRGGETFAYKGEKDGQKYFAPVTSCSGGKCKLGSEVSCAAGSWSCLDSGVSTLSTSQLIAGVNDKETVSVGSKTPEAPAESSSTGSGDFIPEVPNKDGDKFIMEIEGEYYVATAKGGKLYIDGRSEPVTQAEYESGSLLAYNEGSVEEYGAKDSWGQTETFAPAGGSYLSASDVPADKQNQGFNCDGETCTSTDGTVTFVSSAKGTFTYDDILDHEKSASDTGSSGSSGTPAPKKSKYSNADKKDAAAAGVNLDSKASITKFQQAWINENCKSGCTADNCVGKMSGTKCVPDGLFGPKTKAAIKKKAKEPKTAAGVATDKDATATTKDGKPVTGAASKQSQTELQNLQLAEQIISPQFVKEHKDQIDWANVKQVGTGINMPLNDGASSITATGKDTNQMQEINFNIAIPGKTTPDPEKSKSMLYVNNQPVAEQSLLQGQAGTVNFIGMGPQGMELQTVNLATANGWDQLKEGKAVDYFGTSTTTEGKGDEEKLVTKPTTEKVGTLQLVNGVATNTNHDEERQVKVDMKTGTTEDNDGDYDEDTKKFTPTSGFYSGAGKRYIADHDTNDDGLKTSTTLVDAATGFKSGKIQYDSEGNVEWKLVNNNDGTVTITKPNGDLSQPIDKGNTAAMAAFLDGDKSYAQVKAKAGSAPPGKVQADKPAATDFTLSDPSSGQAVKFHPNGDGTYEGTANGVDTPLGKKDVTTTVKMVGGEPVITKIYSGSFSVCNNAADCKTFMDKQIVEGAGGMTQEKSDKFKEQFKNKHKAAQATAGPAEPVVDPQSIPATKSEFEPTNSFASKVKEKEVELSQIGFFADIDGEIEAVSFDDAGIIGPEIGQPPSATTNNGEIYLLIGGKWQGADGNDLPSNLQTTFNNQYGKFSAKKAELTEARMDDIASSDITWDQLTDTAKKHFADEAQKIKITDGEVNKLAEEEKITPVQARKRLEDARAKKAYKEKKEELNAGFTPIIGGKDGSSTQARHSAVSYGLSYDGEPVECKDGQCYTVTAGTKTGADGAIEITQEKGKTLTPDQMKNLQVANNELGEIATQELKQTLAVREFNEPIQGFNPFDAPPGIGDHKEAGVVESDYVTNMFYTYKDNPNLKASEAIGAIVTDAIKNPDGYNVMIGGEKAVLGSDGEYYRSGDLDEFGDPYVEGSRIKMNEDTKISVEKKLQDPDEVTVKKTGDQQQPAQPVVPTVDWKTATPEQQRYYVTALGHDYDQFARDNGVYFKTKTGDSKAYIIDAEGRVHITEGEGFDKMIPSGQISEEGVKDADGNVIISKKEYEEAKEKAKEKTTTAAEKLKDESDLKTAKEKAAEGKALTDREKKLLEASEESEVSGFTTTMASIYVVSDQLKNYPTINNLLWGDQDWYQDWKGWADRTFAPMMGSNWFVSAICDNTQDRKDMVPEGKAVIKTVSGTYQAVASIQMEKSDRKAPILCYLNEDPEADEQFICDKKQVCIESLCYKDDDRDGEPDEDEALEGYFYKITWGVSAPRDESLTPYVDENGISVSFNIWLDGDANDKVDPGAKYMYYETGNIEGPIELKNSAMDQGIITKYSHNIYEEACIKWDKAPQTTQGQFTAIAGTKSIGNVCFEAKEIQTGSVDYTTDSSSSSSGSTSSETTKNQNW